MLKWAWQTQITDNNAANIEDPSLQRMIRWERGDAAYLWVKNTQTSGDFALGDVVYRDITDLTNLKVKKLGDTNTNVGAMAGVVVSTNGIVNGAYGWIQIYGTNSSVNVDGVAVGNEVQTLTPTTNASAGSFSIRVPNVTGEGTTGPIAYNASLATIQTALDLASGVANGIVAGSTNSTGPIATATAITFTFSGTGFAALPWPQTVKIETAALTGTTKVLTVRTTPGLKASTAGDIALGVSGQTYVSTVAQAGTAPAASRYIELLEAYATATPALKKGFIHCLH